MTMTVTFHPPDGNHSKTKDIRLVPDVQALDEIDISMHGSPTTGYHMGSDCSDWFSSCFGYDVELLYVGANRREVLGNLSPNKPASWLQSAKQLTGISAGDHEQGLGLSDCAALLVVSETSLRHVSRMLPDDLEGDITKFRPNVVLSGAEHEYEEDFWSEIAVNGNKLLLTANCNRCVSLNIDYKTGDFATGPPGTVLKSLMKERRVDEGAKYSPVFGRYGFVEKQAHGASIKVNDPASVTDTIAERTKFCKRNSAHYNLDVTD
ncbi:hypothetical protein FH972_024643 [Carpinus fangiana]|uniref:MOSC domain-containing protein n=1 Tax=Carpinus fangiana TaxID=176857 RepID=A0A5N6KZ01_9ROSI|nr:hypothetical protein FH972_024643 [Carpinus fangiana]